MIYFFGSTRRDDDDDDDDDDDSSAARKIKCVFIGIQPRRSRMQQAAKKQKLTRTVAGGTGRPASRGGQPGLFPGSISRCKRTRAYVATYRATTLVSLRQMNRRIGTRRWYRMNKDELVSTLVLHHLAEKIQRFFKFYVMVGVDGDSEDESGSGSNKICPISLAPMAEVPQRYRYRHSNCWFDRSVLALHMSKTSDFIHPVTRVEFREEDILRIDPGLIRQYKDREKLRAAVAEDMSMVQTVENEMEEVFQSMVEAAEVVRSRREFTMVFDNLSEEFLECYKDLAKLDHDRSVLALKSLDSSLKGDPNYPTLMSKKREARLRNFLRLRTTS